MSYGLSMIQDDLLTRGVLTRRVLGWLVDVFLLAIIVSACWTVGAVFGLLTLGFGMPVLGLLPLVPLAYHCLFLVSPLSATPGQALFGLRVRRDDDLLGPTLAQALVSTLIFYLTLATSGLLLLVALFTVRKRALHDLLSGLVVVRDRALTAPAGFWNMPHGPSRPLTASVAHDIPGSPEQRPASGREASYKPPRRPQFFYTTAPLPCPYVSGRTERKVVTEITGPDADQLHDRLSRAGFRRSHNIAYAPVCPSCQACVPIRIPVDTFQPDRTLRRIARSNARIEAFEVPARATAEQFQLFQRYQRQRHTDGDMATMTFYDYRAMVEDTPIETLVVEFRDTDDRLVGACLADRLGDGLSAVYSFFAPGLERRSLGTFTILWLIERARTAGLPFVYLGYWVPESRKMSYKARFRPSEVLANGTWRVLTDADLAPAASLVPETAG